MKNIFFITACALILFACKAKEEVVAVKDTPVISDSLSRIIKIDTVKNEYIEDQLSLSGEISYDDNKVIKIFPNASGQVVSVNVSLGDKVKKGQTLAVIKSADVAGDYADLSTVSTDASIAEKEYKNAEQLYKNGINSEKDFNQAKLEYDKALNAVKKVQMQIEINGGGKTKAGGIYVITAPRDGFIVEKNINAGSFIRNDNSQNLFTISGMQDVWVLANVFETDIPKIKAGQPAEVTTLAYPDKVFYGKVDQLNTVLDPLSKAMKIKIVLPNTGMLLKPEMFTNIVLAHQENQQALEIPTEAIISDNGKNYVVIYQDKYHVRAKEVNILKVEGTKTYIQSGLQAGDLVISKNQILLYNSLIEE
ncbi:MAG: efflux RND transporter periplasmic adaptor subunit [Ginsengibacter sp.]